MRTEPWVRHPQNESARFSGRRLTIERLGRHHASLKNSSRGFVRPAAMSASALENKQSSRPAFASSSICRSHSSSKSISTKRSRKTAFFFSDKFLTASIISSIELITSFTRRVLRLLGGSFRIVRRVDEFLRDGLRVVVIAAGLH